MPPVRRHLQPAKNCQHWLQNSTVDAIALDEETLGDAECQIDHADNGRDVARFRPANFYFVAHSCVTGVDILSS
jgi:hypothetical protein